MEEDDPMLRASSKFWEMFAKATAAVIWAGVAAMVSHEIRLTRIEETRFSDADGLRMRRDIDEELHQGPAWLRPALEDLKKGIERIDERTRRIDAGQPAAR